jgi:hypothetical protein
VPNFASPNVTQLDAKMTETWDEDDDEAAEGELENTLSRKIKSAKGLFQANPNKEKNFAE